MLQDAPPAAQPTAEATRRIMREIKPLLEGKLDNLTCSLPNESDCYTWHVELRTPPGSPLAAGLMDHARRYGGPAAVVLAVHFSGEYPAAPPFVRVVSPRFAFHTGHVTVGGSICMQELTASPEGWSPAFNMESVFVMVHQALLDGEGAVDERRGHIPYSYAEARMAFTRVARQHGWS